MSGSAYVLEVPIGGGAGAVPLATGPAVSTEVALPEPTPQQNGGRRRARRSSVDAFLESEETGESGPKAVEAAGAGTTAPTGRRRRRAAEEQAAGELPVPAQEQTAEGTDGGTGRRRGRPSPAEGTGDAAAQGTPDGVSEGAVVMAGEHGAGTAAVGSGLGGTVPPQGVPVPSGRRARRDGEQNALPAALPAAQAAPAATAPGDGPDEDDGATDDAGRPSGRRRRALAAAAERAAAQETGARAVFALPPAEADRSPEYVQAEAQAQAAQAQAAQAQAAQVQAAQAQVAQAAQAQVALAQQPDGRHDAMPHNPDDDHTPPQPHPASAPTGRRRARQIAAPGQPAAALPAQSAHGQPVPALGQTVPAQGLPAQGVPGAATAGQPVAPGRPVAAQAGPSGSAAATPGSEPAPASQSWPDANTTSGAGAQPALPAANAAAPAQPVPAPLPPERPAPRIAQPLPAEATPASAPADSNSTQGRAISVRTLGQGVPFARQVAAAQPGGGVQAQTPPPHGTNGGGRRRKLGTPPEPVVERPEVAARSLPQGGQPGAGPRRPGTTEGAGRSYAIGAPDENAAEGPEPLDGPGGAVEVADRPQPRPVDDELPPEPLDNPRRLLVWPAPDATTQQALSDRGYRPVIVNSREEVDAQIAAFPAALFVDPLTGPITRTALQSLRQAAVAAEVPVLVTAGLGQATREAAYGADPAVLLKALAPRDSEQHPPRVLLIEEHAEIALALTATLERRGMQVARASTDEDAVTLASQMRPNLVVMDLMQVRRRRAGIVDWLRANGQLNRTPLVVYTAAVDPAELPRLAAGESVLFLAERSTSAEVQDRIVDLLARIGTN
jgi:CheY-like chemotaxis protein